MTYPAKYEILSDILGHLGRQIQTNYKKPTILGPDGNPIRRAIYPIERRAAARKGSLKTWLPRRVGSYQQAGREREFIIDRALDLLANDPHAAGIQTNLATMIIGTGLMPYPSFDYRSIGMDKERSKTLRRQFRQAFKIFTVYADAGNRMDWGSILWQSICSMVCYGEFIWFLPMIDDPDRPFALAIQMVNPIRLKTPIDKINDSRIKDGIELGAHGEPIAYWIKKPVDGLKNSLDVEANFTRIELKTGSNYNIIHKFIGTDPEQVRGVSMFAPAVKFFRDLNDYLDAELVSNIVTAAFSMFIEVAEIEPEFPSAFGADISERYLTSEGVEKIQRYEQLTPGGIMYGGTGEKPHVISAQRPGATFEPFVRMIEKAISLSFNVPYSVLFKDLDGMTYAGYRSALLEAWRVVLTQRRWLGQGPCQIVYRQILEEAWLRNMFELDDFYRNFFFITQADWIGPAKGQIEPVKEEMAYEKAIKNRTGTRRQVFLEKNLDPDAMFDEMEDEEQEMRERGLVESEQSQSESEMVNQNGNR